MFAIINTVLKLWTTLQFNIVCSDNDFPSLSAIFWGPGVNYVFFYVSFYSEVPHYSVELHYKDSNGHCQSEELRTEDLQLAIRRAYQYQAEIISIR